MLHAPRTPFECPNRAHFERPREHSTDLIGLMGIWEIAQECFGEGDPAEKDLVAEGWLGVEDYLHLIDDAVYVVLATESAAGQDEEEEYMVCG